MKICEYLNNTAEIYTLNYIIALADLSNPIEIHRPAPASELDPYQQSFYIPSKYTDIDMDIFRKVEINETKKALFYIVSTRYAELIIGNLPITDLPMVYLKTGIPNRVRIDLVNVLIYT